MYIVSRAIRCISFILYLVLTICVDMTFISFEFFLNIFYCFSPSVLVLELRVLQINKCANYRLETSFFWCGFVVASIRIDVVQRNSLLNTLLFKVPLVFFLNKQSCSCCK